MTRVAALCAVLSLTSFASLVRAQEMPAAYKQVLDTLGKTGDFKDNVLKVNIPRNDLIVTVANVKTPTPFGFGGWVAMTTGSGGMDGRPRAAYTVNPPFHIYKKAAPSNRVTWRSDSFGSDAMHFARGSATGQAPSLVPPPRTWFA